MELKEYNPLYREVCGAIWLTSQTASCPSVDEDVFIKEYRKVYHHVLPGALTVTAYQDSDVEAFISLSSEGEILLFNTAVCFQKKGHGRALLARAKELFPKGLFAVVHTEQEVAIKFFQKSGFVQSSQAIASDEAGSRVLFCFKP